LVISLSSKGQNNVDIIGIWKVVSASTSDFYINFRSDSVSLSSEMRSLYPDSADQNKLINNAKNIYGSSKFSFEKNGVFKQYMDTFFLFEGKYRITPSENIIVLTTKNSLGKEIDENITYSFNEGELIITMKYDKDTIDFILEKR
jgi:hypothetical protein